MSNKLIPKLTQYNKWANDKFIECLLKYKDEMITAEVVSSFPNIFETCKHIWLGELGWYSRMTGLGWQTKALDEFSGSPKELYAAWGQSTIRLITFAETEDLHKLVDFTHDGIEYSISRMDIITTVINHGNYHRGQIVTLLRQLGVTNIPKTDYIEWVREQARTSA